MPIELDQRMYREILESLGAGVYLVDLARTILFWNAGAEKISGYPEHEVIGRSCFDDLLVHCDEHCTVLCGAGCPLKDTMNDGKPRVADVFLRHKAGHRIPVRVRSVPIHDEHGAIIGAAESFDERMVRLGADLRPSRPGPTDLADAITGLPDHDSVHHVLDACLEAFRASQWPFGVLIASVDKLEEFRELHGKTAVEAILRVTARTLAKSLCPDDLVGRWLEGRFVAIVTGPAAALPGTADMLKRMVASAAIPWWGDHISVTLSIGGTFARMDDTVEELLRRSEEALEASLAAGDEHVEVN